MEFLRKLRERTSPAVVDFARRALQQADGTESGLEVRWGESGPLFKYFYPATAGEFTLCGFSGDGKLTATEWVASRCQQHGLPDEIWQHHLQSLAALFRSAEVRESTFRDGKVWHWITGQGRKYPDLSELASKQEAWLALLLQTIEALRAAMDTR